MNNMTHGFQVMGYGLIGVFSVLILFYIVIVLLNLVFPYRKDDDK